MDFGNPDGSVLSQSFDIALPAWLLEEKNQLYVLAGFFILFVITPMIIIHLTGDTNNPDDLLMEKSKIKKSSIETMVTTLDEALEKNIKKKVRQVSDYQFIEIFENSRELQSLNDTMGKKVIIRDLIKQKINGLQISDKFIDYYQQIEDDVPRLCHAMLTTFTQAKFVKTFMEAQKLKETGKISYTLETISVGMVGFVNKVLKNFEGKTAYQGYTFEVKQQKEADTPADEA